MKKCLTVLVVLMAVLIFSYQARAEILGYPWSTWGELSYSPSNDVEQGVKLDMYVEQGIDWTKIGNTDWVFNNFAGVGLTASDHASDFWNNKVRPTLGLKFKHPVKTSLNNWGEIDIGIRGEYYGYFDNKEFDSLNRSGWRAVAFFQWSIGGDWKNRR